MLRTIKARYRNGIIEPLMIGKIDNIRTNREAIMVTDSKLEISVTEQMLQGITQCIVQSFHPLKIILFGSYAYGNPMPDSDIDLLVVMEERGSHAQHSAKIAQICRPRYVAMDILVRTPAEIKQQLSGFDPFLEEILTNGIILYEASG